nr:D-3-phosphoglycerate dehydrogenase 1, chloroplastic-like [Tanacetum cinerariifolium]
VLREPIQYVTLAEKLHKLYVHAMLAKGICVNEEQVIVGGSSDKPLEIIKVQIANAASRLASEIKVEGRVKDGVPHLTKVVQIANAASRLASEIKVEGRVKDGVPHLTKVGALNIDRKQAVMVIAVHEKPSKKPLNKID